ncbi:MAG: hypothetical protein U5J83_11340 [Bryobacterales bacterium]|nr:hypothetical protein [Bryobacterales bacterium]
MSVQTSTETAAKDRMFSQSISVLYLLTDVFLILWLLRAGSSLERILAGFSILGVTALLLKTVDRLKSSVTAPVELSALAQSRLRRHKLYIAGGFALWLGLYSIGCSIGAYRYLQAIQSESLPLLDLIWNALVLALSYTYSNVGILCVISALIGSFGRLVTQAEGIGRLSREVIEDLFAKAILRSAVIAGVVIGAAIMLGSPTTVKSPDPYISFALMMSAVGLVNGYMPQWFYHEN